jgi:hypothetical protein
MNNGVKIGKKYAPGRVLAILALLLSGISLIESNATAAGLPTVRVDFPTFEAANETFVNDGLGQYYAAGGRSFFKYVGAGSTITITYTVTTDGTTPAADKTINFLVNAPYSGSKAAWEVNGTAVGPSKDAADGYGLKVSGKTDSNGKVSFTIKNTDSAANAEAIPTSETQPRAASGRLYGNMKAVIDGLSDMQQIEDLVTFDITKAAAATLAEATSPTPTPSPTATATPTPSPTPTPTATAPAGPFIRLVAPAVSETTAIHRTDLEKLFSVDNPWYSKGVGFWQVYMKTGSSFAVSYKVTDGSGAALPNKAVTLHVNKAYSKSNAQITDGKTATNSKADDSQGNDQAVLTGVTNSQGIVTFNLKNTDTKGEADPASMTAPAPTDPKNGAVYSQLYPEIAGPTTDVADFLEVHFYGTAAAPAPTTKTITCVKGKASKKVTGAKPVCPKGYTLKK